MASSSVTGAGQGIAVKAQFPQTTRHPTGPIIFSAGSATTAESGATSPPSTLATVTFPEALIGVADDYAIMLTSYNAGSVSVMEIDTNANDAMTGFTIWSENEGEVFYAVIRKGNR